MKTSTRSAMDRLAAARPPVADHTEDIVPRAERARLLHSITTVDAGAEVTTEPVVPPGGRPSTPPHWIAPIPAAPHARRRVLVGALVASVVAAGVGVAGLVGTGDDSAQVSAGPGTGGSPAAPVPATEAAGFLPGLLPTGLVLQEISVEPGGPTLPGNPYAEVYGRTGPDGTMERAVAVLTATEPDALDALLAGSGATSSPVPGRPGEVEADFGQGLVARSFNSERPRRVCGTGGCVELADQAPQRPLDVMVMGRDLPGGTGALDGIVDGLVLAGDSPTPGDRVEAPHLVADGYQVVYEGDRVPGLVAGTGTTTLRYGDDRGQRTVDLWHYEGQGFDPAGLAWQYPQARPVEVGGQDGLLVVHELGMSVTWQERPGLALSVEVSGMTENEALDIANGMRPVGEDEWRAVVGTRTDGVDPGTGRAPAGEEGDSVSGEAEPTGPLVVLSEGRAGSQRWELVGYPVDPSTGSGADTCTELRLDDETVSVACSASAVQESSFIVDNYVNSLGPAKELDGEVLFQGLLHPEVATVRFLLDTDETLDVPTVGRGTGLGTHVVAVMPEDAQGATVVLLDEAGAELQRLAFPSFRPVGG